MRPYHVSFWSGQRAHAVGCDIEAVDEPALLDGLSRAGRYAVALRRESLPAGEIGNCGLAPVELAWLALVCGPAWLFVVASYWLA